MRRGTERGQVLVELQAGLGILLLTITGSVWVLRAEWHRLQCARVVFETTHAALHGETARHPGVHISLTRSTNAVRGRGSCGDVRESVTLQRLESAGL